MGTYLFPEVEYKLWNLGNILRVFMFNSPDIFIPFVFRDRLELILCQVSEDRLIPITELERNRTHKACQMPISLFRKLVVTSVASSGIPVTTLTNHFKAGRGKSQSNEFAAELAPLTNPGIRNKNLNFKPLGLSAR
jgi:hypothetical protein